MIDRFGGITSFKERVTCMKSHVNLNDHIILDDIVTYYDLMYKIDIDVAGDCMKYGDLFKRNDEFFTRMAKKYPECGMTNFYVSILDYKKTLIRGVVRMSA